MGLQLLHGSVPMKSNGRKNRPYNSINCNSPTQFPSFGLLLIMVLHKHCYGSLYFTMAAEFSLSNRQMMVVTLDTSVWCGSDHSVAHSLTVKKKINIPGLGGNFRLLTWKPVLGSQSPFVVKVAFRE